MARKQSPILSASLYTGITILTRGRSGPAVEECTYVKPSSIIYQPLETSWENPGSAANILLAGRAMAQGGQHSCHSRCALPGLYVRRRAVVSARAEEQADHARRHLHRRLRQL